MNTISQTAAAPEPGRLLYERFMRSEYHAGWEQLVPGTRERWNDAAMVLAPAEQVTNALEVAKSILRRICGGRIVTEPEVVNALTAVSLALDSFAPIAIPPLSSATPPPEQHVEPPRWRVFEDVTRGWWGIEEDTFDGNTILYPKKINREPLDGIVLAHNAALAAEGRE